MAKVRQDMACSAPVEELRLEKERFSSLLVIEQLGGEQRRGCEGIDNDSLGYISQVCMHVSLF